MVDAGEPSKLVANSYLFLATFKCGDVGCVFGCCFPVSNLEYLTVWVVERHLPLTLHRSVLCVSSCIILTELTVSIDRHMRQSAAKRHTVEWTILVHKIDPWRIPEVIRYTKPIAKETINKVNGSCS